MAKRFLKTLTVGRHSATIYHDAVWAEYVVHFRPDGVHNAQADYHTDDKADAFDTAQVVLEKLQ